MSRRAALLSPLLTLGPLFSPAIFLLAPSPAAAKGGRRNLPVAAFSPHRITPRGNQYARLPRAFFPLPLSPSRVLSFAPSPARSPSPLVARALTTLRSVLPSRTRSPPFPLAHSFTRAPSFPHVSLCHPPSGWATLAVRPHSSPRCLRLSSIPLFLARESTLRVRIRHSAVRC